ncbi:MAG TPA: phytanoyl-CoA dioxygenase family protein [Polyangiaceae bacterium]|jgi:ectoine hydroxylase-related dioxygenase (phytanoyl-CoA dioxygenase family)|nr:phytanoyl-CoA dioxygenase family protein [Polyangiaceae bacterium]
MTGLELAPEQVQRFHEDGFIVLPRIIEPEAVSLLRERFDRLFAGEYDTGLVPDEVNWKAGRDDESLTRQICNAWKADRFVASVILRSDIGKACATLGRWPGTRLSQDNLLWKPPRGKPIGFHQDSAYERWTIPPEWVSCWIALDDTVKDGGTVEYVRGSHLWGQSGMIEQFHGPAEPVKEMRAAAELAGVDAPERVPIEVPAGGGTFHFGWTWHGSDTNRRDVPRRSIVAHCMSSEARFHPTNVGYIYSRYKRFGDDAMDETHFPILWRNDGYRSAFLDPYVTRTINWGESPPGATASAQHP